MSATEHQQLGSSRAVVRVPALLVSGNGGPALRSADFRNEARFKA
ncbi:hypothetical protein SNOG_09173 [Parastagonospora nodorum SN15]|uniref:Uncharacterized protein n=1 Tax=Phaeosphaeria nodorum (strain SN15 / ATCC MYA-4574 / FGSC 10173) TaxID=321614 RepID=Q0UGE1_PHANO|nr:hypothetical protein SNOG_09173 [Parastagonospora nodorum SN15]EAT83365.1 hypothetical protein SNOG_09173 [Parastagonospora nodorum SN15]